MELSLLSLPPNICMPAEVVLAVLLRTFKFSPSGKEVVWNLAGVNYPTVGGTSNKPSMPLKIELLRA